MSDLITGLACPVCSGTLAVREGQRIVKCPYCHNTAYVKGERGLARYQVARKVDRKAATDAVLRFWDGFNRAADLKQKAAITEMFLAYLPYWRGQANVTGWIFGRSEEGSGDNRRKVPRERKVREPLEWTGAAGDVGEFGVSSVTVDGKSFAAYDSDQLHSEGMVFEPSGSADDAQSAARESWFSRVRSKAGLVEISQQWLRLLRERFSLVFYPLWVARYSYRNRIYPVVVDGYSGKVLYGKAPGNIMFRAAMLVAGTSLGACTIVNGLFLAFQLIANSKDSDEASLVILALPFIGGAFLIGAGYQAFRYGEEIEHREKKV
jgi:hypothetical protein